MEYKIRNDQLVLLFKGELNSSNADDIERECLEIIGQSQHNKIILDFNDLAY